MVNKKVVEDFETYAAGVKRLKELEQELDSLDTRKFKVEEREIRRKLKSVHMIPQIERDINDLKAKISGVDVKFLKSKLDFEQTRRIAELERREQEMERQLSLARKGLLTRAEVEDVDNLPSLKNRVSYLKALLEREDKELKKEIDKAKKKKIKKQLTKSEVRDVESIPSLRGKTAYLRKLLEVDEQKLKKFDYLKDRVDLALSEAKKKELTEKEKDDVESIPRLRGRLSYLKNLMNQDQAKLAELEALKPKVSQALKKASERQLTKKEIGELESILHIKERLSSLKNLINEDEAKLAKNEAKFSEIGRIPKILRKTSLLGKLFSREQDELHEIEKRIDKIPGLQGKITHLSKMLEEKSFEISKEAEEIDSLKHKLGYFKKLLEEKESEMQEEIKKTREPGLKRRIFQEVRELESKVDSAKEELYNKITEETSESKWMMQQEKEEIRQELKKLASVSADIIKKGKDETNRQLLEEIEKLNNKLEASKIEINQGFASKIVQLRKKIDELEEKRKKEQFIQTHTPPRVIPRSRLLGIKSKFLPRIEHLDDMREPKIIREINMLAPITRKEAKKEIKIENKHEISELPMLPLTSNELGSFITSDYGASAFPESKTSSSFGERKIDLNDIKKEIEAKQPKLPGKRKSKVEFKQLEKKEEKIDKIEVARIAKSSKIRIPKRKFMEQERYSRFFNSLIQLRDLSENRENYFDNLRGLKESNEKDTEKSIKNLDNVRKNLLQIHSKLFPTIK